MRVCLVLSALQELDRWLVVETNVFGVELLVRTRHLLRTTETYDLAPKNVSSKAIIIGQWV